MLLTLDIKPFSFRLIQPLETSQGILEGKKGWLLHLENSEGKHGWGEVSPFSISELDLCKRLLERFERRTSRKELEAGITCWPGPLAFGIGAALAELDGLIKLTSKQGWLKPPPSAILLPKNQCILNAIDLLKMNLENTNNPLTLKWKIARDSDNAEEALLFQILKRLPPNARVRLDANAGLNWKQAQKWARHFHSEPRLEWFEQPLPADNLEELFKLAEEIPVALDESLFHQPSLRNKWQSWQVRRPLIEGDPRKLLKELHEGIGYRVLSTAFETGIGLRWLHHLAALQNQGPTPTAPGLAPGWCPKSPLFSRDPITVWEAA